MMNIYKTSSNVNNKLTLTKRLNLSMVLMCFSILIFSLKSYAGPSLDQKLTVAFDDVKLSEVLVEIETKTSFNFFYNVEAIKEDQKVSFQAKSISLKTALNKLGNLANFEFKVNGKQIILKSRSIDSINNYSTQGRKVSGTIVDQNGSALPGANIQVKGTQVGTQSDFDGNFSINLPEDSNVLVITFVGFKKKEVDVSGRSEVKIQLEQDLGQLDAVVVIGSRGEPRTSFDSPVAVDNFSTRDLKKTGKPSIDQQLMLKVPSYTATEQPVSDAAAHFSPAGLRGLFPSRTLVLLNGKRKNASALVYSYVTPGRGEVGVDMKAIPSAALENVEVLRDGAAAQYGSDAIAGVINLKMKKKVDPFVNTNFSSTTRGDGEQYQIESGFGVDLGENGYANLTLSHMQSSTTQRAGKVTSVEDEASYWGVTDDSDFNTNDLSNFLDRNPSAGFQVGLPETTITNFAYNFGFTLDEESQTELYSFGTLANREGSAPQFARVPYWVPGFQAIYPDQDFFLAKMAPQIRDHTFALGLKTVLMSGILI